METFSALPALCVGNSPVPVNSPHKGQWRGALMFSLICGRINDWVNNREAGDLRRHRGHCDVIVMVLFADNMHMHYLTHCNNTCISNKIQSVKSLVLFETHGYLYPFDIGFKYCHDTKRWFSSPQTINTSIYFTQNDHVCRWPGEAMNQDIISQRVDPVVLEYHYYMCLYSICSVHLGK